MAAYLNWEDDFSAYTAGNALPNATNGWTNPADANAFDVEIVTAAHDAGAGPQFGANMAEMNRVQSAPRFASAQLVFANAGISISEEVFVRFWAREDSDHWGGDADGGKYFRMLNASQTEFNVYIACHGTSSGNYSVEAECSGSAPPTTSDLGAGDLAWKKWEYYVSLISGTRTIKVWLNDTLVFNQTCGSATNMPTRLYTASNSNNSEPDTNNHFYIDKMQIFTDVDSGIGTEATSGTMADGDVDVSGGGGGTTRYERIVSLGGQRVNLLLDK